MLQDHVSLVPLSRIAPPSCPSLDSLNALVCASNEKYRGAWDSLGKHHCPEDIYLGYLSWLVYFPFSLFCFLSFHTLVYLVTLFILPFEMVQIHTFVALAAFSFLPVQSIVLDTGSFGEPYPAILLPSAEHS